MQSRRVKCTRGKRGATYVDPFRVPSRTLRAKQMVGVHTASAQARAPLLYVVRWMYNIQYSSSNVLDSLPRVKKTEGGARASSIFSWNQLLIANTITILGVRCEGSMRVDSG